MTYKRQAFENLGYDKMEPKPEHVAFSFVKTKEGWVPFRIELKGEQITDFSPICLPTVKAYALESFRLAIAKHIMGGEIG